MSRVAKKPITLPKGVEFNVSNDQVTVKGPKGTLSLAKPTGVEFNLDNGVLQLSAAEPANVPMAGTARAILANMVTGVSEGFTRDLDIVGVGYRALPQGPAKIELQLGFSHPVFVDAPEGITFDVPQPTRITVKGADKQLVGQVAADIRKLRKPEPYKGKGIRYSDERVLRKAGKSAK